MRPMPGFRRTRHDSALLAGGTVAPERKADGYGGGWVNKNSGQGGVLDRHSYSVWAFPAPLDQGTIDSMITYNALARRIAAREPQDATRRGFELASVPDAQRDAIFAEIQRLRVLPEIERARTWARAYGGGALVVIANDGRSPEQPLDLANLRRIHRLIPVDRYDLPVDQYDINPASPLYGRPLTYRLTGRVSGDLDVIHASRVIRFEGVDVPERIRRYLNGWGGSVLDLAFNALRNYDTGNEYATEAIVALSQGVFSQRGLADLINADGVDSVVQRAQGLATGMGTLGHLWIDADNESFDIKARNIAGLRDAIDALTRALVAATGMPRAVLLGEVPGGLGNGEATGEFRAWYDHVSALQTTVYTPAVRRVLELIFASSTGPTAGVVPDDFAITWNPLTTPSEAEQAAIRLQRAQARTLDVDSGTVTDQEVRQDPDLIVEYGIDPALDAPGKPAAPTSFAASAEDDADEPIASDQVELVPAGEFPAGPLTSLREAGERIGVSPGQIRGMVRRGEVQGYRLRANGPIMVQWQDVREHLEAINAGE